VGTRTLTQTLAEADSARVVQLSDTHLTPRHGVPDTLQWLLDGINAAPPDLLVVSGDIVFEDPDDDADREFAHAVLTDVPCPVLAIPGNHDIGFYGEDADRSRRIAAFTDTWRSDRFAVDVAGWRLVGANAYLLGDPEHDEWLHDALTTDIPVAVFVHQPLEGEPNDGWEMPDTARSAFHRTVVGADIRLVASGHRHQSRTDGVAVWAPSTTILGLEKYQPDSDTSLGAVEYTFRRDGDVTTRFLRP